jgi:hypothetical protein
MQMGIPRADDTGLKERVSALDERYLGMKIVFDHHMQFWWLNDSRPR